MMAMAHPPTQQDRQKAAGAEGRHKNIVKKKPHSMAQHTYQAAGPTTCFWTQFQGQK